MVQCLIPPFGRGNRYIQIIFDSGLPNEVSKTSGSKASIKWYILSAGFTRYNAFYFDFTPVPPEGMGETLILKGLPIVNAPLVVTPLLLLR